MRSMRGDRVRLTALANVALFLASVVGLVTVDDSTDGVLVAAAEATARSGTAAFSIEMSMETGGEPMRSHGTGRIDFGRKRFILTLQGFSASETINDDGVVYVRTGAPGRKPWIAFDRGAKGVPMPVDAGLGSGDPLQALEALRRGGVARNVKIDGTEEVRGTPTTRWVADLDTKKLGGVSDANRQFLEALGIRHIRYSLWLSDDGVVRRMRTVAEGTSMSTAATTELYDFGVAAEIEVPPADQVERIDLSPPRR